MTFVFIIDVTHVRTRYVDNRNKRHQTSPTLDEVRQAQRAEERRQAPHFEGGS